MKRHMRRMITAIAVSGVLLAVGCSSDPDSDTEPSASIEPNGTIAGVTVPDAFTSLTLIPIGQPTFPFLGTDQKYHVAYDLQLTNASRVPATLDKLEVVDGMNPDKVIAEFSGTALVDPNCSYGNCNRIQDVPAGAAGTNVIPPQESRVIFVDYTFDSLDDAPEAVLHHLYGTGADNPAATESAPIDYVTTPIDISASSPRVISPPLRGDRWIAVNGCCLPGLPHRSSTLPVNGKINNSQRFALDWMRLDEQGSFYSGDKTDNASYADYDADVHAVADATVVAVLDDVEANAPGVLPAQVPALLAKITVENVDGNHIILDLGGGVYAMYAHLIKGSLLVKPGDKVTDGQVIAKLGNTGNANAPHLHFQLMDGPSLLEADGLPYAINEFDYAGQVDEVAFEAADDYLTGTFSQGFLPEPSPRKDELPGNLAVINFPAE